MTDRPERPTLPVDFNNSDEDNAVRLITQGTLDALEAAGIDLAEGMEVIVTDDEFWADGVVTWRDGMWVAVLSRWREEP